MRNPLFLAPLALSLMLGVDLVEFGSQALQLISRILEVGIGVATLIVLIRKIRQNKPE